MEEELPQLFYGGQYLRPERGSYSFTNPDGSRRTPVSGGPMLIRTDHLGGPFTVNVEYVADSMAKIQWFQLFWLRTTFEGSVPFQAALALDSPEVFEDYVVRLAAPPQWNQMTGFLGRIRCQFEVEQKIQDLELLDVLYFIYAEYGDDACDTLNELEILTNPVMDLWIPAEFPFSLYGLGAASVLNALETLTNETMDQWVEV